MLTRILALVLLCSYMQVAWARPTIGLALSGGGAKGAAHVGVLKYLEQHNIPVDYIAGTSIGAYVGALYALGYRSDEIEQILLTTPFADGFSDQIPRQKLSIRDKARFDLYNIPFDLGVNTSGLTMPEGLLRGQTMYELLFKEIGMVPNIHFDQLPIKYRAISTDLANKKMVVHDSGKLLTLMQASMSVPGILAPIHWQNLRLVDGGIMNNMPVDVVKNMGADIVIAVDIAAPLQTDEELTSALAVIKQLSTFLTVTNIEQRKAMLESNDILISPDISQLSTTDFSRSKQAIELGYIAAEQQHEKLLKSQISDASYQQYQRKIRTAHQQIVGNDKYLFDEILVRNNKVVPTALLRQTLNIEVGQPVDVEQVLESVNQLYALNYFQKVTAHIEQTDKNRLVFNVEEKSWGPNYLDFGIGIESGLEESASLQLYSAFTKTDLNQLMGQWRVNLALGKDRVIGTQWYQPLTVAQSYFSSIGYQYQEISHPINPLTGQDGEKLQKKYEQANFELGANISNWARISTGFEVQSGRYFDGGISRWQFDTQGAYAQLLIDNLDSLSFPQRGLRFNIKLHRFDEEIQDRFTDAAYRENGLVQLDAQIKSIITLGANSLQAKGEFTQLYNSAEISSQNITLGGFLRLSGFGKNSLLGTKKAFGLLSYRYDLGQFAFGNDGLPLYLGASIEAGNVWQTKQAMNLNDLIYASSLFIGTQTPVGPAAFAIGVADSGDKSLYLFLGKQF